MSEDRQTPPPPPDLLRDAESFFAAAGDAHVIDEPDASAAAGAPAPSALQRLGAPPFPKSRFPFVGFLASVYDHISAHARGRAGVLPTARVTGPADSSGMKAS